MISIKSNNRKIIYFFTLLLLFVFFNVSYSNQKIVGEVDIIFVNSQTSSKERLLSQIETKPGSKIDKNKIDKDIKSIYKLGNIEKVRALEKKLNNGKSKIVFEVQERALFGGVSFNGNNLFSDEQLSKKIKIKKGKKIDDDKLNWSRESIQLIYSKKGFPNVSISYKIKPSSKKGFSDVIFNINEGSNEGLIRNIKFYGNKSISSFQLKKVISQKGKKITNIFSSNKNSGDAFEKYDIHSIESFYKEKGYLDAKVEEVAKKRVNSKYVDLIFKIKEGNAYKVGKVRVKGDSSFKLSDEFNSKIKLKKGSLFSSDALKEDVNTLTAVYGNKGYAHTSIDIYLDRENGKNVNVTFDVKKGKKYRLGKIIITGNENTRDKIIRREIPISPGDNFDPKRIEIAKKRLMNMNYFSDVRTSINENSSNGELIDVSMLVKEKPTGQASFGLAINSTDKVTGFIEISESNFDIFNPPFFRGGGQRFKLNIKGGEERRDAGFSFTEPWMFDRPVALGLDGYYKELLFLSDHYDQKILGGSISLRKSLGSFLSGSIEYRAEKITIDPDVNAPLLFKQEEGKFFKSSLGVNFKYDDRDSIFLPTRGKKVQLGINFVGLGGDVDDMVFRASFNQHFSLPFGGIFSLNGAYAKVNDGDHIFMRQFLGGLNSIRSFDHREVGPRDPVSKEVIGGNQAWNATAEVTLPILDKTRVAFFYDIGEVSEGDDLSVGGGIHSGWGIGLRLYQLGAIPISLDYAFPVRHDDMSDDGGKFQFSAGLRY